MNAGANEITPTSRNTFLIGNCQAEALAAALNRTTAAATPTFVCRQMASPDTYFSHPGKIPPELCQVFTDPQTHAFFKRPLQTQFEIIGAETPAPRAIILTLFHEVSPLYIHKQEHYIFHISESVHHHQPQIGQWIKEHFSVYQPDSLTYINRFAAMLEVMLQRWPHIPFLVLQRPSPMPAYAPNPFSYLEDWKKLEPIWYRWRTKQDKLVFLDVDRVIGGLLINNLLQPRHIFPFFKMHSRFPLRKFRRYIPGLITPWALARDIEHATPTLWNALAHHILHWLEHGHIAYRPEENPAPDSAFTRPPAPDWDQIATSPLLREKNLYAWANLIESILYHPRRTEWSRLVPLAEYCPADEYVLRNLRVLLDLYPRKDALPFLQAHRHAIEQSNRETHWKADYLATLDKCIKTLV